MIHIGGILHGHFLCSSFSKSQYVVTYV